MERQILCGNGKALEVVTSSDGRYDACLEELGNEGFSHEDMAMKRLAQARLLAGDANNLWQRGGLTTNGFVFLPNTDILVTAPKYTPFLRYVDKAVAEHKASRETYVGDEFQELMDNAKTDAADAIKSGVLLLKSQVLRIEPPVEAFGDTPVTCFLLEEFAKEYGMALKNKGGKSVRLIVAHANYVRQQNRPFSRGLWVCGLGDGSASDSDDDLSRNGGRVFGVRELSAAKQAAASGGLRAERSGPWNEAQRSDRASLGTGGATSAKSSTGKAGLDARIEDATERKVSYELDGKSNEKLDENWLYVPVRKDALDR